MRPLILRLSPLRLREWLFARVFLPRAKFQPRMFADASLAFAKNVRMRLLPTDVAHGSIAFTGSYELGLTRRIAGLAREGGLMVDVGANFGYFSLLWAGNGSRNRVVAFEASPRNVTALRANIARNQFEARVAVRAWAVGRERGVARFSLGPADQTGWGGLSGGDAGETDVEVVTLDDEFADGPSIDVLKIDIEGADTWALFGARRLLTEKRIRNIFFEQNLSRMKPLGIREGEATGFLRDLGYDVRCISTDAGLGEFHAYVQPEHAID